MSRALHILTRAQARNEVDHMPFYATSGLTRQIRHFK
jgi:hypothetical protein